MDDPVTRYEEAVEALVRDLSPEKRPGRLPSALRLRVLRVARAVVGRVVPGEASGAGGAPPPGGRGPDKAASGLAGRASTTRTAQTGATRTSENPLKPKFGECAFHALG